MARNCSDDCGLVGLWSSRSARPVASLAISPTPTDSNVAPPHGVTVEADQIQGSTTSAGMTTAQSVLGMSDFLQMIWTDTASMPTRNPAGAFGVGVVTNVIGNHPITQRASQDILEHKSVGHGHSTSDANPHVAGRLRSVRRHQLTTIALFELEPNPMQRLSRRLSRRSSIRHAVSMAQNRM